VPTQTFGSDHGGPVDLPALNHDQIAAQGALTAAESAAKLREDVTAAGAQIQGYGDAVPSYVFHGGERVRADVALGLLLGELVVHGWDVARALRRPWPIDPADVAMIFEALGPVLPGWVRPERIRGVTARFEIRLRGQDSHVWEFRDGRLHVDPVSHGRMDVCISAEPARFLLACYRREPQWKYIATGQILAWGAQALARAHPDKPLPHTLSPVACRSVIGAIPRSATCTDSGTSR
jgi:hypothetical protein